MPLLPQLKAMFDAQRKAPPMPTDVPIETVRGSMHDMIDSSFSALAAPQAPLRSERDVTIPVDGGEITLRIYDDREGGDARPAPCHIHYHGGGFFLGTLDQSDGFCRSLARQVGCVVVSVDYRLAPEYRFPTAAEDSYAALCWVDARATKLRIDRLAISVGGGSAGGNLAAVVCMMARDRHGPSIAAQVLEIPVTDFTSDRALTFPDENIHIAADKAYARLYLRDEADATNPLASPLLTPSLADLPPALMMCAQYDQLQPEGEAYARRLADAGVPCEYILWQGQFHGSQRFDMIIPDQAKAYQDTVARFLSKAFADAEPVT